MGCPIRVRRTVWSVPDTVFADPRLAAIYDDVEGDRCDLDHYEAIVDELGARSVLDIGCGTGMLGCRLAARGVTVIGVDPAQASLAVARAKPGANRVTWLLGDATTLPPMTVDVVTMTGNVAQVFVREEEWSATLSGAHRSLRDGGHLVFETRDPSYRGWKEWTRDQSIAVRDTVAGRVEHWVELTDVTLPFVSFRHTFRFMAGGDIVTSESTLRFRSRDEITAALVVRGFRIAAVRDAPDRPGREMVFVARSTSE
jgi:SAM-dependent methyltransferase